MKKNKMNAITTEGITVEVLPKFEEKRVEKRENFFLFSYKVKIVNNSNDSVQLMSRHWYIVEANGQTKEVKGEGVIGMQPILHPTDFHEYSSWCPIRSEIGKMYGTYQMKRLSDGKMFDVKIPVFNLIPDFKYN